jgi:lactoylglutathione lyase
MVKLGYTILYVANVTLAMEFYEKAFDFQRKFMADDGLYGELLTGETTLAFADVEFVKKNFSNDGFIQNTPQNKPFGIEIGIVTDDVFLYVQKARNLGAVLISAPENKSWGQMVAYIRDLDGFLVEICTEIGSDY